jgi:hypothetical protein
MALLRIPTNTDLESVDLETHVLLAAQRYTILEDKIAKLEQKTDGIIEKANYNKRVMIGALITVVTGAITSFIALLFRLI